MSDDFSGPAVMGDPSVDITDFYAFPSPERPGNLVLIMNVFPMATSQSFFSDVVTYRFRLRPLTRSGGGITHGTAEHTIDVTFGDVPEGTSVQKGDIVTSDGREASFVVGNRWNRMACASSRDWPATRSSWMSRLLSAPIISGKLSFNTAATPSSFATSCRSSSRCRSLRSSAASTAHFGCRRRGDRCHAPRQADPDRRVGRPEIKNFLLANRHAIRHKGVELRDLYNREDAFSSPRNTGHSTSRVFDANLAFFDGLDAKLRGRSEQTAPSATRSAHRRLPDPRSRARIRARKFLEIERALLDNRPHATAGGRWLETTSSTTCSRF